MISRILVEFELRVLWWFRGIVGRVRVLFGAGSAGS